MQSYIKGPTMQPGTQLHACLMCKWNISYKLQEICNLNLNQIEKVLQISISFPESLSISISDEVWCFFDPTHLEKNTEITQNVW